MPYPAATDDHQIYNAREMAEAGGARVIKQTALSGAEIADADTVKPGEERKYTTGRFTPAELCRQMQKMALEPGALANAAKRARACGRPLAAADLADLAESLGTERAGIARKRKFGAGAAAPAKVHA